MTSFLRSFDAIRSFHLVSATTWRTISTRSENSGTPVIMGRRWVEPDGRFNERRNGRIGSFERLPPIRHETVA